MSGENDRIASVLEHQIFWMLVKKGQRRDDVGRVYLAIQSALAHQCATVDVGSLVGALMPEGRRTNDAACDQIGADGLAYFHWLYKVELTSPGRSDHHHYLFCRRGDGARVSAYLRTAALPKSLQFQQTYERQKRELEAKRARCLATYRLSGSPAPLHG